MSILLGIFLMGALASAPPEQPTEQADAAQAGTATSACASTSDGQPQPETAAQDGIRESLTIEWSPPTTPEDHPCFSTEPGEKHTSSSGAPIVHSDIYQVSGRMDTADRRGQGARAILCNRRIDLSASQPAATESSPTPVPGPGSVGVFLSAALALLRRRRE